MASPYPTGTFCWWELVSGPLSDACGFYERLFGWETTRPPVPMGDPFVFFQLEGNLVAGAASKERSPLPHPEISRWVPYVSVPRLEDYTERVWSGGGVVLLDPTPILWAGRLAAVQDPVGTVLGLWEPHRMAGAHPFRGRSGTPVGGELLSPDLPQTRAFFETLLGWQFISDGPQSALLKAADGSPLGWARQAPCETCQWLPLFSVTDLSLGLAQSAQWGAVAEGPAAMAPHGGWSAPVRDPQGALYRLWSNPSGVNP